MSWQDSVSSNLAVGLSLQLSDSVTLSDAIVVAAEIQVIVSDDNSLNWADAYSQLLRNEFFENLNNWAEDVNIVLEHRLVLSDDAANLADTIVATLTMDIPLVIIEPAPEEQSFPWAEDIAVGYGITLSDNASNWADAFVVGKELMLSDDMAAWVDAFSSALAIPPRWQDEVVVELEIPGGKIFLLLEDGSGDVENPWQFADDLVIGYGIIVEDNASNLADTFVSALTIEQRWKDSVVISLNVEDPNIKLQLFDDNGANWQDAVIAQRNHILLTLVDSFALDDDLRLEFDFTGTIAPLSDDVNNLADEIQIELSGVSDIPLTLFDVELNQWLDGVVQANVVAEFVPPVDRDAGRQYGDIWGPRSRKGRS